MSGAPRNNDRSLEEKRALVAQLLREKASRPRIAPLSFVQQRLWFISQLDSSSDMYNLFTAVRLAGKLDLAALLRARDEIIRRHETLRTTFEIVEGQPSQIIAPAGARSATRLRRTDLRALPEERREPCMRQLTAREAQRPFELDRGPLVRFTLLQLGHDDHVLLLVMHHMISDGWSLGVLIREVATLYAAYAAGAPPTLPDLPIQYADYAIWQRGRMQGDLLAAQLDHWRGALAGAPFSLALPYDRPRPPAQTFHGSTRGFVLPESLTDAIKELNIRESATLFMTMLAVYGVLLARYSGQDDLLVGTPIANRTQLETERLIGCFVNSLVMRVDSSGDPSFRELLGRVRAMALGAYAHQDIPFERLVEALQPARDLSRSPLFQVVFALQNAPLPPLDLPNLTISFVGVEGSAAQFDLTLMVVEMPPDMLIALEYNTDLFDAVTIERMGAHLRTLVAGAVAAPHLRISELPMLSAPERQQILVEWNDTAADLGPAAGLHQLFAAQAARSPDAVALVFDDGRTASGEGFNASPVPQLTYAALDARANQLAQHLRAGGAGPETVVAVALDRAPELVLALLAILSAGSVYLPLDPSYPPERLRFMRADSQAHSLIHDGRSTLAFVAHEEAANGTRPSPIVNLRDDWPAIIARPAAAPPGPAQPAQLAYLIYTSGSTGQPKGAMNTHAGIVNRLRGMQRAFQLAAHDRVLHKTPISFDVALWELTWPLIAGATLVLARPDGQRDPAYLARALHAQRITTVHFVPAMLRVFLDAPAPAPPRDLRRVICSGEALDPALAARARATLGAPIYNLYGPTEAAIDVTAWPCAPAEPARGVPIGRPVANSRVYVLDRARRAVPLGVAGELYLGGVQLARGYHARPDLTAARFVPNPVTQAAGGWGLGANPEPQTPIPEPRLYRTGDRARWRADGALEYLGRADGQIKLRGVRIELGEVEAALGRHPSVQACAVVARAEAPGDLRLVAYLVPTEDERGRTAGEHTDLVARHASLAAELRAFLAARLPAALIPAAFVALDALPLTPSGKLDRRALPAPDRRALGAGELQPPRTPHERQVAEIWQAVLGLDVVGADDNFFELGGHSLLATQVISRIRAAHGVDLPLRIMFESPTVAGLARALAEAQDSPSGEPDARIEPLSEERADALLDQLDQLSDADVETLLGALLPRPDPEP